MYCINQMGTSGASVMSDNHLMGNVARLSEVLYVMYKVRIWHIFQTYKFRDGKDHYCLKRTYKSEENARSQSCPSSRKPIESALQVHCSE